MIFDEIHRNKSDFEAEKLGCYFDPVKANRIIKFCESVLCTHEGRRAGRITLLKWQRDLLRYVWGWRNPDGTRRIRWLYLQCARQVGKSFLCFCLSMAVMCLKEDHAPNVVSCAVDRKQAKKIWKYCRDSIIATGPLRRAFGIRESNLSLSFKKNRAEFIAIGSLAANARGPTASLAILDEVCFWRNDELYNAIRPSIMAQPNGLLMCVSTPGLDKAHFTYDACYLKTKRINSGEIVSITEAGFIFEADQDCSVDDESQFLKACPSLYDLHSIQSWRDLANEAVRSKIAECSFRQEYLGQWAQKSATFVNLDHWQDCIQPFPKLDHMPAVYAIDGSTRSDLTMVVKAVPYQDKVYISGHAFCPEVAIAKREKSNLKKYSEFVGEGTLTKLPGDRQELDKLRQWIYDQKNPCEVIVFDVHELLETSQILATKGYKVLEFIPSTRNYNGPLKMLEQLLAERRLVHEGKTLFLWSMQNLQVERDSYQRLKPSRQRSIDKIDPSVCVLMALSAVSPLWHHAPDPLAYWNKKRTAPTI